MLKYKPFPFSVVVLLVLIFLHAAGSYFFWYWSYPWFDIVIHILGGLWSALVFLWLASYLNQIDSMKEYRAKSFMVAVFSAMIIGIIWELVENLYRLNFVADPTYSFNTAMDLLNDVIGGVLAYLYFTKNTRLNKPVDDNLHGLHSFYNKIGVNTEQA